MLVANWKMQLPYEEALSWLRTYSKEVTKSLETRNNKLVICPSFTEIADARRFINNRIMLGAQDVSSHERGPYTGDVSPLSLAQLGCKYTLIGHSERRQQYGETDAIVAQKAHLLMQHGIEPIICVGETRQERDEGSTVAVLEKQLILIAQLLSEQPEATASIAYEPVWAIGAQQIPRAHDISDIFRALRSFLEKNGVKQSCALLYGGSVNERTIKDLGLSVADGFLLGRASVDSETLKKIILSC